MVIQLCKQLPPSSGGYILYTDNFFTSTKLFKALRTLGIGACGTAKSGSGYPPSLLAVRDATTKKNNWGLKAHTVVDEVLCMAWVDLNTVQLMTTAYDISDIKTPYFLPPRRRHGIPEESVEFISPPYLPSIAAHSRLISSEKGLPVPYPIRRYNQHMGGSDGNAQQRACYTFDRKSPRYWWPLFIFLHDAACLNAYIIYKTYNNEAKDFKHIKREAFIRSIADELINQEAGNQRKFISKDIDISSINRQQSEHRWMHLEKKQYCDACKVEKSRSSKRKREPLAEVDGNEKKRRKRGAQTRWGCAAWICQKKAACKTSKCWNYMHIGASFEDEMNEEDRMDMRREDMNEDANRGRREAV